MQENQRNLFLQKLTKLQGSNYIQLKTPRNTKFITTITKSRKTMSKIIIHLVDNKIIGKVIWYLILQFYLN